MLMYFLNIKSKSLARCASLSKSFHRVRRPLLHSPASESVSKSELSVSRNGSPSFAIWFQLVKYPFEKVLPLRMAFPIFSHMNVV